MADLGNLGNKLLSKVDQNATLIGSGVGFLKSWYGLQGSLTNLLRGTVHGPDVAHIKHVFSEDPSYKQSIAAIVGGYIMQESGIGVVDKVGGVLIKAASGFLIVRVAEALLWSCTHSEGAGGGFTEASGSRLIGN